MFLPDSQYVTQPIQDVNIRIRLLKRSYSSGRILYDKTFTQNNLMGGVTIEHGFSGYKAGLACSARIEFTVMDFAQYASMFTSPYSDKIKTSDKRQDQGVKVIPQVYFSGAGWFDYGNFYAFEATPVGNDLKITAYDAVTLMETAAAIKKETNNDTIWAVRLDGCGTELYIDGERVGNDYYSQSLTVYSEPTGTMRNSLAAFALFQGGSFYLKRSECGAESASTHYSKLYTLRQWDYSPNISQTPAGLICTVAELDKSAGETVNGCAMKLGEKLYKDGNGTYFIADVPQWLGMDDTRASTWNQKVVANSFRISDVIASGVVLHPLYELGDIVSIDLGNGTYYNFVPTFMRVTIDGIISGELSSTLDDSSVATFTDVGQTLNSVYFVEEPPEVEILNESMLSLLNVKIQKGSGTGQFTPGVVDVGAVHLDRYNTQSISNASLTVTTESGETQTLTIQQLRLQPGTYPVIVKDGYYVIANIQAFVYPLTYELPVGATVESVDFNMLSNIGATAYKPGGVTTFGEDNIASVSTGGTGATTSLGALKNLGITSGKANVNATANAYTDVSISFGKTYTEVPIVVVGFYSNSTAAAFGGLAVAVNSITTTGCNVRVFNSTSTGRTPEVRWVAIGE